VRVNDKATSNYRRQDGEGTQSGGYQRFSWPTPKLKNFEEINAMAEANGGTIEFRDDKSDKSIRYLKVDE
jgi:hypothetical protein